ncbi:hypothetical protein SLA2020_213080 [Shorea laevis]
MDLWEFLSGPEVFDFGSDGCYFVPCRPFLANENFALQWDTRIWGLCHVCDPWVSLLTNNIVEVALVEMTS